MNHYIALGVKNVGEVKLGIDKILIKNRTGSLYSFTPNITTLDVSETDVVGNVSRDSCGGFNGTIDEIILTTGCPDVYDTFQGSDIVYQSC